MTVLSFLLARFSEPSSYAGLGAVLALAGLHFSDTDIGQIAQFLAAGCGLVALLLRERGMIQVIVLGFLLGGTLGACGPLVAAGGGGRLAIANRATGADDSTIQTACIEYQKGRGAAQAVIGAALVSASAVSKISVIEEYGDAACATSPEGDAASTAIWLGELVRQIGTLTSGAAPQP